MQTGEDERGLRKIVDMTRLMSIVVLGLHYYYTCYGGFKQWGLTATISDNLLRNIQATGLFDESITAKLIALGFLIISLMGAKGRKSVGLNTKLAAAYISTGLAIYFLSFLTLRAPLEPASRNLCYIAVTTLGFILTLTGGTLLSRVIRQRLNNQDIFNTENETFPQEERLLQNEYSINLPAQYYLKGKLRKSWINIINPFRSLLVLGSPGSGKSYFVIQHVIKQHIEKGFAMLIYDFKFDDLSRIAYNAWLKYKHRYKKEPAIYFIDFEKLSHRCNPLEPKTMVDITDAAESARTILMGLNRQWIQRQGDFFVESPINFLTAIIWYLRKYQDGNSAPCRTLLNLCR